tara:strand:- start:439 stop:633 length:195 start_codon:yes stop_codon:yes gene_type:complete
MTTITGYDLIFSFALFFFCGVMLTLVVQGVMEIFARRRQEQQAKIDKIAKDMHDMRLEMLERKF